MSKRSKPRILQWLATMFICLSAFILLPHPIQTVHASGVDYVGGSENVSGGTGVAGSEVTFGWGKYYGYRIYAITEDNKTAGEPIDVWFGSGTDGIVQELTQKNISLGRKYGYYFNLTRAGLGGVHRKMGNAERVLASVGGSSLPVPFMGTAGNGDALRAWIYTVEDGQELCNGLRIIRQIWGFEQFDAYYETDKELYIVIEALSCHDVLDKEDKFIGYYAGTAYGWQGVCNSTGQPYGNQWIRRGTNGTLGICLYIDDDRFAEVVDWRDHMTKPTRVSGLGPKANPASNWLSGGEYNDYGYGTHVYTFSSLLNASTHTWDYPLGNTPGPAPEITEKGKQDKVNIIKIYCTKDKETGAVKSWDGSFIRTLNPKRIAIEDEVDYVVEDWRVLKTKLGYAPGSWPPIDGLAYTQKGSSAGNVTLNPVKPDLEQTLAVLLVKYEEPEEEEEAVKLILNESEITHYYELSEVDKWKDDRKLSWSWKEFKFSSCPTVTGSWKDDDGHRHNTYCKSTGAEMVDKSLLFKAKNFNENAYKSILATKGDKFIAKIIPENGFGTTRGTGAGSRSYTYNYKFVIHRGEDELTLANWSIKNKESSLWKNNVVNTLVNRQDKIPKSDRWTDRETKVPLVLDIKQDPSGDYKTSAKRSCGHSGSKEDTANNFKTLLKTGEVEVYTYSGQPSGTTATVAPKFLSSMTGVLVGNGKGITDDTVVRFYPYICMTYQTLGQKGDDKTDANVLSQHKRSLKVNEYFEAGYNKSADINLLLTSQQWSMHKLATDPGAGNAWAEKNNVLPGGAIYQVNSGGLDAATVVLRTYQFVSEGDNRQRLVEGGTSFGSDPHTVASATAAHQAYVQSSIEAFNNGYFIEQGVNKDPMRSDVFTGTSGNAIVERGGFGLNGRLSEENKYYLNNTAESVGNIQSALLQAGGANTGTRFYRFHTLTNGEVYMAEGTSYGGVVGSNGTKILNKDEGIDKLKNDKAKEINTKTGVVSVLISALERNTGDDETASWVDDGHWYNESFDLVIMVQTSQYGVGIGTPSPRETVLDPALYPSNTGKADYFSKAYSSQYRMSSYTIKKPDVGAYLGTFKENDISVNNIQNMFKSKVFKIPNVNVQDLKD